MLPLKWRWRNEKNWQQKKLLMVCEAFGGGVFTYVSQLCNDMVDDFDVYLAYSLRPQTPKNYKDFLDKRVHLIQIKSFGEKSLTNIPNDIKIIKEPIISIPILRQRLES